MESLHKVVWPSGTHIGRIDATAEQLSASSEATGTDVICKASRLESAIWRHLQLQVSES